MNRFVWIFALCGCQSSLLGDWSGTCLLEDANQEAWIEVRNQVQRDNGYLLEGTLDITTWEDDIFEGSMIGDHNGKYVMFRTSFETESGPYQFRIETERVGQTLEGDCIIQAPDSVGSLVGAIDLER
jgi:hypothetical protein